MSGKRSPWNLSDLHGGLWCVRVHDGEDYTEDFCNTMNAAREALWHIVGLRADIQHWETRTYKEPYLRDDSGVTDGWAEGGWRTVTEDAGIPIYTAMQRWTITHYPYLAWCDCGEVYDSRDGTECDACNARIADYVDREAVACAQCGDSGIVQRGDGSEFPCGCVAGNGMRTRSTGRGRTP